MKDHINPDHYKSRSMECIHFTRHMNFDLGNAFKYAWRLGMKDDEQQEHNKIKWYMKDHNLMFGKFMCEDILMSALEQLDDLSRMESEFSAGTYKILKSILFAKGGVITNDYLEYIQDGV